VGKKKKGGKGPEDAKVIGKKERRDGREKNSSLCRSGRHVVLGRKKRKRDKKQSPNLWGRENAGLSEKKNSFVSKELNERERLKKESSHANRK